MRYEVSGYFWKMEVTASDPEQAIREAFVQRLPNIERERFTERMQVEWISNHPPKYVFHVFLTSWNAFDVLELGE